MALPPAPSHPRRLAFLGTPEMSARPLRALVDHGYEVVHVVSRPDRRRSRRGGPTPSPVKQAALDAGLPVTDRVDDLLEVEADLGVVVAFGQLIRPHILRRLPMVNLHFSLLPRWRGAAPVERAILAGDERTGVDLMALEEGLDTGGIYDRVEVTIGPDETAAELRGRLTEAGTRLLLDNLGRGLGEPVPQQGDTTYAAKVEPAELEIDWSRPAVEIHRLVRVGGAWTTVRGKRLKVWRTALDRPRPEEVEREGAAPTGARPDGAAHHPGRGGGAGTLAVPAGDGVLHLVEVQPEGGRRMRAADWANGARWDPARDRLGS